MKKSMTIRGRFGKWREKRMIIRKNKELCERFPFLIPWHRFTGERFVQLDRHGKMKAVHDYNWSYTDLDSMPDGWRKAFGMKMCEEIREELIKWNDLDRWQIIEMKEKYGHLSMLTAPWATFMENAIQVGEPHSLQFFFGDSLKISRPFNAIYITSLLTDENH